MEIAQNNLFGLLIGPGDVTQHPVRSGMLGLKGEGYHRVLPRLGLHLIQVYTGPMDAGRRPRLKPAQGYAQPFEGDAELFGWEHAVRPSLPGGFSHKDAASQERTCCLLYTSELLSK